MNLTAHITIPPEEEAAAIAELTGKPVARVRDELAALPKDGRPYEFTTREHTKLARLLRKHTTEVRCVFWPPSQKSVPKTQSARKAALKR